MSIFLSMEEVWFLGSRTKLSSHTHPCIQVYNKLAWYYSLGIFFITMSKYKRVKLSTFWLQSQAGWVIQCHVLWIKNYDIDPCQVSLNTYGTLRRHRKGKRKFGFLQNVAPFITGDLSAGGGGKYIWPKKGARHVEHLPERKCTTFYTFTVYFGRFWTLSYSQKLPQTIFARYAC